MAHFAWVPSGLDYGVGPLFTAGSLLPSNNYVDMILSIYDHLPNSDESEPSWLEPELELKDFQLGLACDLFSFQLDIKDLPKMSRNFDFVFDLIFIWYHYDKDSLRP